MICRELNFSEPLSVKTKSMLAKRANFYCEEGSSNSTWDNSFNPHKQLKIQNSRLG